MHSIECTAASSITTISRNHSSVKNDASLISDVVRKRRKCCAVLVMCRLSIVTVSNRVLEILAVQLCRYIFTTTTVYGPLIQKQIQKKSDTLIPAIITILHSTSNCSRLHLQRTNASSFLNFKLFISSSTTSFHVLFGLPLGPTLSTTKSTLFYSHSLSSFRNTWPYHLSTVTTSSSSSIHCISLCIPFYLAKLITL